MTPDSRDFAPETIRPEHLPGCPADYRFHLTRLLSMQAYAERCGATELARWVGRAPDFRLRRLLARILADEADHACRLYDVLDRIGVGEADAIAIAQGRAGSGPTQAALQGPLDVGHPDTEWDDVVLNHMFLDRAGRFMVENFATSSYAPWAAACKRILRDEHFHQGFGFNQFKLRLAGVANRTAYAAKVTRWYAHGLNFFGPPSSSRTQTLRRYGLKRRSNEELRGAFRLEVETLLDTLKARDLLRLERDEYPYA